MDSTLLLLGIACIIAAIVGGGLKAVGFEFPPLSSIGRQIGLGALGVILVLVSRSYVPNPPDVPKAQPISPSAEAGPTPTHAKQSSGMLAVRVVVTPPAVQSGEKATVYAEVTDPNGDRVEGASVVVAAGGGRFLESADAAFSSTDSLQGPFSAGGRTSVSGAYTTWWVCRPCAPAYGLTVKASKSGFIEGSAEATVRIH